MTLSISTKIWGERKENNGETQKKEHSSLFDRLYEALSHGRVRPWLSQWGKSTRGEGEGGNEGEEG